MVLMKDLMSYSYADSGSPDYDVIMGLLEKSKNIGDKNEVEAKKYLEKYHESLD